MTLLPLNRSLPRPPFLSVALAVALLLLWCGSAKAAQPPYVMRITGTISEQMLFKVRTQLVGFRNTDPFPAGLIVVLDSLGGDTASAMAIGYLLRQQRAHVFVANQCDSACFYVLAGGVVRGARGGSVGVHAGRLTVMSPSGKVLQEVDASKSLTDSFTLAGYNRDIRQYLQAMGISHELLDVILSQRPEQMHRLSQAELIRYRVTGMENTYLKQRVEALQNAGIPMNAVMLFNRSMRVSERCLGTEKRDDALIDCYMRVLLGR